MTTTRFSSPGFLIFGTNVERNRYRLDYQPLIGKWAQRSSWEEQDQCPRTEEIEPNVKMYCYHVYLDAAFTAEEMISKQTKKRINKKSESNQRDQCGKPVASRSVKSAGSQWPAGQSSGKPVVSRSVKSAGSQWPADQSKAREARGQLLSQTSRKPVASRSVKSAGSQGLAGQ